MPTPLQEEGDLVYIPSGGWYHQVLSNGFLDGFLDGFFNGFFHGFLTRLLFSFSRRVVHTHTHTHTARRRHQVLSLARSASVSFNVMDAGAARDAADISASFCRQSAGHQAMSRRACNVASELRPAWYSGSCCPAFREAAGRGFAGAGDQERFPVMSELEERMTFPHKQSSIG
jgi:hypothetical protein